MSDIFYTFSNAERPYTTPVQYVPHPFLIRYNFHVGGNTISHS